MGRLRGCLWLTAGLVVALLAGGVAFIALQRATAVRSGEGLAGPRIPVVVAARTIEVRSQLTAQDLELKELPVEAVPQGALRELEAATGKITLVELYPDEVILEQRLLDPNVVTGDGRLALILAEDQVLMAFPVRDLMSRVGVLKPGDHVDLLFSLDFPAGGQGGGEGEQTTFNLLQSVTIAAIVGGQTPTAAPRAPIGGRGTSTEGDEDAEAGAAGRTPTGQTGPPEAILLTVSPQDALVLKYAMDAGGIVDIVLRAPGTERPFDTEPVDIDYMINSYRIPTGGR